MSPLIYAIIGCGLIGRKRAASLAPGQLAWACDPDRQRAEELAATHPGCQVTADAANALADARLNAVIISTINHALAPLAMAAIKAGKHVLIEKPGGLNAQQLRNLQAAANESGTIVRLGYNHRYHPGILKARELHQSGALGPLMFLRARYGHGGRVGYDREWRANPALSGGGELIDQGVHLIDLAGWFLGDFTRIEGHAQTCFWDMPVDDNAFLSLQTSAGQTAWLHVSCTEWKNLFSLEIYGRDAKVAVDGLGGSYGIERCTFYRMLPQMGPPETTQWDYPAADTSWAAELAAFAQDIVLSRQPQPGLAEGIRTLEIVETIYQNSGYKISTAGLSTL